MQICSKEKGIPMKTEEAIRSAKFLKKMFSDLDIIYWFDRGALLGVIREKRFIPWDTDIELYLWVTDKDKPEQLKNYLKKHGFEFRATYKNVWLDRQNGHIPMCISWFHQTELTRLLSLFCYYLPKFVRIGIIRAVQELYSKNTKEWIRPTDSIKRDEKWSTRNFRLFLPIFFAGKLIESPLYDFTISVPAKSKELLLMRYGKKWKTPLKSGFESYTA